MATKTERTFSAEALEYVEKNWITLWKCLNAGGLVQHQIELAIILTEYEARNDHDS